MLGSCFSGSTQPVSGSIVAIFVSIANPAKSGYGFDGGRGLLLAMARARSRSSRALLRGILRCAGELGSGGGGFSGAGEGGVAASAAFAAGAAAAGSVLPASALLAP